MELLVISLVTVVVLMAINWSLKTFTGKNDQKKRLPPGPRGVPVLGYLPFMDAAKPYDTLYKLSEKYGSIYSLQMGRITTIILTDAAVVKKAFSQHLFTGRADLFLTHGIMEGYGIICAEGDRWKNQRRFLLSCLKNFGMVKLGPRREQLQNRIMVGVDELLDMVERNTSRNLDILNCAMHCVGNVMNSLVFGRTWQENDPVWTKLRYLAAEGVKLMGVAGPVNFLPICRFIPKYKRTIKFVIDGQRETHDYYQKVIDEHDDSREDDLIGAFKKEMARYQCDSGKQASEYIFCTKQFHHFLADAHGAGLDTTVATLNWFLLFMAVYPHIQKKLQDDIDNLNGITKSDKVLLNSIERLPYLEAAIAETQRIRPITPIGIPHSPLEDVELEGYHIPKRSMVVPLIWAIHMNPNNWENPNLFNPDRFIDDTGKFFIPHNFIPYQTGKRACIGGEFSRMMMFLFCANILKNYTVTLADSHNLKDNEILDGICGIIFVAKQRQFKFMPRNK